MNQQANPIVDEVGKLAARYLADGDLPLLVECQPHLINCVSHLWLAKNPNLTMALVCGVFGMGFHRAAGLTWDQVRSPDVPQELAALLSGVRFSLTAVTAVTQRVLHLSNTLAALGYLQLVYLMGYEMGKGDVHLDETIWRYWSDDNDSE